MSDIRENLGWIIGSIATAIAMAFGWFISSGEVVNLLYLLVGAGIGYFVQARTQKKAWKRENALTMREEIYGPLYADLSKVKQSLQLGSRAGYEATEKLKETMDDYLFQRIPEDLKAECGSLVDALEKYDKIYWATEKKFIDIIRKAVEDQYSVDVGHNIGQASIRFNIEDTMVDTIWLEKCLFQGITPSEFIESVKERFGDGVSLEIPVGGTKRDLDSFQSLYRTVREIAEKEPLYTEERRLRMILVRKLSELSKKIEVHVEVD